MRQLTEAYRSVTRNICQLSSTDSGKRLAVFTIGGALVYAVATGADTAVIAGLAAALASIAASNQSDG